MKIDVIDTKDVTPSGRAKYAEVYEAVAKLAPGKALRVSCDTETDVNKLKNAAATKFPPPDWIVAGSKQHKTVTIYKVEPIKE